MFLCSALPPHGLVQGWMWCLIPWEAPCWRSRSNVRAGALESSSSASPAVSGAGRGGTGCGATIPQIITNIASPTPNQLAGTIPQIPANIALVKNLTVHGGACARWQCTERRRTEWWCIGWQWLRQWMPGSARVATPGWHQCVVMSGVPGWHRVAAVLALYSSMQQASILQLAASSLQSRSCSPADSRALCFRCLPCGSALGHAAQPSWP